MTLNEIAVYYALLIGIGVSAGMLLVMNLIGLGLGPTYLGAASDLLRPTHPDNSLQLAFYTLVPFYVLAVVLFLVLGRRLRREAVSIGDKT